MSFLDQGYQIFPDVVPEELLLRVRQDLARLLAILEPGHDLWRHVVPISVLRQERNPGVPREDTERIPFIFSQLTSFSEVFRELILLEEIWAIAREVLQSDEVVYHFSNITRKPAHLGPNLSWHRDYPNQYICTEDSSLFFRALIPLEDMDSRNGCTEVIPETHRLSDELAVTLEAEKRRDFDITQALEMEIQAGSLLAIHSKLAHGGRENRSAADRNLLVLQFGVPTERYLFKGSEPYSYATREEIRAGLPLVH